MSGADWRVEGDYFESCNCEFLCPCIYTNMVAAPTTGDCKVAMAFHITTGHFSTVSLDDLNFVYVVYTPGTMAEGDWTVGIIVDDRANDAQHEAITAIVSGNEGGPMAMLAQLVGTFAGVESRPIHFEKNGLTYKVSVPDRLEEGVVGMPSFVDPAQPIVIDNTAHPANTRLGLAKATHSHLHAFGINWDDDGELNNGHFAPFSWHSD